jgi:hypothetical protein
VSIPGDRAHECGLPWVNFEELYPTLVKKGGMLWASFEEGRTRSDFAHTRRRVELCCHRERRSWKMS